MGGGGVEGFVIQKVFLGEGGGERYVMNHNGPLGDRNRCVMSS